MTEGTAFSILLFPLVAFVVIGLSVLLRLNGLKSWAGHITIGTVGVSFVLSLWALYVAHGDNGSIGWELHSWLTLGSLDIRVGFMMDSLTAIMLVVVNGVSLLVQIYSQGYMRGDNGYARYYAFMSLFTASMTGLVMAANVVQMFFFWELVGLCSYLLIGFWYHRPNAARAALKAFLVTRLGDIGFLLAIIYLFFQSQGFSSHGLNPMEIQDIHRAVAIPGLLGSTAITLVSIGIFCGAVGKSAQFPLHTWLPDAMEGPTPASALIHAATMVAAGVFLVARFFPLFEAAPSIMTLIAITGGLTALFAASMALVMNDIKKVIAYSTISQLGYMMLALGIGAYPAAIFHLFNHAFFKALLFLGAGSVNHASGTFDMRFMGGLRKIQPFTYWTFVLASISLVGIFPLAGYWSKDEILAEAFLRRDLLGVSLFSIGLIGVVMTAMYITRVIIMTFHGEFRGGADAEHAFSKPRTDRKTEHDPAQESRHVHLKESPVSMVLPMVILGGLSVGSGFIANSPIGIGTLAPHWFSHLLVIPGTPFHEPGFVGWISVLAVMLGLLGIGIILLVFRYQIGQSLADRLSFVRKIVANGYYIDRFYEDIVVGKIFYRVGSRLLDWFDQVIVDGFVDLIAWFGRNTGRALSVVHSGQLQTYGSVFMIGIGIILIVYLVGS